MAAVQCTKSCRYKTRSSVNAYIRHQNEGKCALSDCGMAVKARWPIEETADLGILQTADFTQHVAKHKPLNEVLWLDMLFLIRKFRVTGRLLF